MQITCGIYLYSIALSKVLACHATRSPRNSWSIPKGLKDTGEDSFDAAVRELYEETGIDLTKEKVKKIFPLDAVKYKKQNKILESFLVLCDGDFSDHKLACHSLVNNSYPEVDKYKWLRLPDEGNLLHESQQANIAQICRLIPRS